VSILNELSHGRFAIAVIHVPPFPTSLKRDRWAFEKTVDYCVSSAKKLQAAGFNSVMIQNVGDEPTYLKAEPDTVAYMSIVGREVKKAVDLPMGICLLNHEGKAPLAIAKACGADYVRIKTYVGTMVKMTGLLNGCYYEAVKYRKEIDAEDIDIFADIFDREGYPLGNANLEEMAHFAVYSCMADGLILTGRSADETLNMVGKVRENETVPVLIGGGTSEGNISDLRDAADGYIVGNCLKVDPAYDFSDISAPKCAAFMEQVRR
jgi:membrane complex biogenesis BtpA family protein